MAGDGPTRLFSPEGCLLAASRLYGLVVRTRSRLYGRGYLPVRRLPCRVISIGNIVAGGTGKTPATLWLAARLREAGHGVAVVSRGYGGTAGKRAGVVSDGREIRMGPEMAGDEPYMMATRLPGVPVLVGADRYRSGLRAVERFGSGVILLDDGFQHLKLFRDLDLVLLDGSRPLGNGHLLPGGPLREPPSALARARGVVLTRWEGGGPVPAVIHRHAPGVPVFRSVHEPYPHLFLGAGQRPPAAVPAGTGSGGDLPPLSGRRVMGVSGIARNDAFRETLRRLGADPVGFRGFPDHHRYTGADIRSVLETARQQGAELLVTTEKDWVRLADRSPWPLDLLVLGVRFDPGPDADPLFRLVEAHLAGGDQL